MPRRYHKSYGDWISTMSFFGVSIYACLKGLEFLDQGNFIRAFFLISASILCLLGSLRYPIARFFDEINKRRQWKTEQIIFAMAANFYTLLMTNLNHGGAQILALSLVIYQVTLFLLQLAWNVLILQKRILLLNLRKNIKAVGE